MEREEYMQKTNVKCQRVQVDETFVPAIQDEAIEVEHLLAEPRNDHVPVDGVLCYREENLGKCYDVENFSCGFEFGLKTSIGGLDSHTPLNGKDDLKLEALDGLLDDVKIDDLLATNGFTGLCEDFFLDFEFPDKAVGLDSGPCEGSLLRNSSSESHSPGLSGSSIGVSGVTESTKVPVAQSDCKNDSLDKRITCELQGAFRNNPCQPSNGDCMFHNSLDMQHLDELDNNHPLAGDMLSDGNEKDSVEACKTAAFREKRFRKPTQRYIEEFANLRSKEKVSTATTKNKHPSVTSSNELHHLRLRTLRKIPGEKSNSGPCDVVLPELHVCKGRPKKEELEYEEPFTSESDDEHVAAKRSRRNDRRKHQRMWSLSEVIKLVDGISEYGVGRWTDIKRVLFSSSSYRTPIDLRDKWRNLLRASSAQKLNKKEAEQKEEQALRPIPNTVLCRVRELAKIHPYPRERGSKKSCVGLVGPSALPAQSKGTPLSLSKRHVRGKKCT